MARKRKAKAATVPTLTRSIVRVTLTADVVVTNEDDYREVNALVNDGTLEGAFYDNVNQLIEGTTSKTKLLTQTVKIKDPIVNDIVDAA